METPGRSTGRPIDRPTEVGTNYGTAALASILRNYPNINVNHDPQRPGIALVSTPAISVELTDEQAGALAAILGDTA